MRTDPTAYEHFDKPQAWWSGKRGKLTNLLTGEVVAVLTTTDSPDSSYGMYVWVDEQRRSYGQCQFGPPVGYALDLAP